MKKRVFSLLLALPMLFSLIPFSVNAAELGEVEKLTLSEVEEEVEMGSNPIRPEVETERGAPIEELALEELALEEPLLFQNTPENVITLAAESENVIRDYPGGPCGEHVTWSLEDGVIYIRGVTIHSQTGWTGA